MRVRATWPCIAVIAQRRGQRWALIRIAAHGTIQASGRRVLASETRLHRRRRLRCFPLLVQGRRSIERQTWSTRKARGLSFRRSACILFFLSLPLVHVVYPTRRQRWKKKKRGPTLACAPFGSDPQKNCRGSRVPPIFSEGARPWVALDQKKFFVLVARTTSPPPRCSLHFFTFAFLSGSLDNTSSPFLRMYAKETEKKKKHSASPIYDAHSGLSFPRVAPSAAHHPLAFFFFDCPTLHFSPTVTLFLSPVWKKGVQQNVCDEGEKRIAFPFFIILRARARASLSLFLCYKNLSFGARTRKNMTTSCALCFLDNVPLTHVVSWTMFECGCAIHQDKTVCVACFVALSQTQSPCPWCRARLQHYRRCGPRKTRALTLPTPSVPSSASLMLDVAHRPNPSATFSHST